MGWILCFKEENVLLQCPCFQKELLLGCSWLLQLLRH